VDAHAAAQRVRDPRSAPSPFELHEPLAHRDRHAYTGERILAHPTGLRIAEGIRSEMIARGLDPIVIEGHPDDAAGMRKLAAGRRDAVYSNRDRAWRIVRNEKLDGRVRFAGPHQEILYYAGINRSYSQQDVIDRFFDAWRLLFASGEAQAIVVGYGLEPAAVD
jgi:hypothetical protein